MEITHMAKKIKLTQDDDVFKGKGKDEIVNARGGDDSVSGGGGNDTLKGGAGNDVLKGGAGDDTLNGGADNDILFGGAGDDRLIGGAGDNTVDGGEGDDTIVFSGNFADAKVSAAAGGGYVIEGLDGSKTTVSNVELFTFADGTVTTTQLDEKVTGTDGKSFTLTEAIDNVAGTAGADTITAGLTGAGNATLTAGDQVVGGDGVDVMSLFGKVNADAFATATVSGVEVINGQLSAGSALNVSGNKDVTNVNVIAGTAGVSTVTLTKAQAAGVTGSIDGTLGATNDTLTLAFSDATPGTADSAKLVFTDGAADILDADAVETFDITANGTANSVLDFSADSVTTLNITGAGKFSSVFTAASAIKTVDASANTGGVTLDIAAGTATDLAIKGSNQNDTFTLDVTTQTAADVVELGDGADDTVLFSGGAATFNSAVTAALISKLTGVEELGTVNTALTVDGSLLSMTQFSTSGNAGQIILTEAKQGTTLEFGAGTIQASSAAMQLGANTLNVELQGSKAAAADVALGLTVTGSSTINVVSTGTAGVANNVLALTAADNQAVVLTGSQNTTLSVGVTPGTTGASIDASAFTGNGTITGSTASDIVKGGTGTDIISGGTGAVGDTLTGGAGADTFLIIAGITAGTADVVTDFVHLSDKIDFGAGADAGSALNYTEGAAPVADFAAALAAANVVLTSAVADQYNAQQVGSDIYLFYNDGGAAGADQVVKLTGVNLANIDFLDIV